VAIFREVSHKGYITKYQKPLHKFKKGGFKMYGSIYRVFQKELYNFESVYKFIQRTYTTFSTVKM
jgi:hypothetical protein